MNEKWKKKSDYFRSHCRRFRYFTIRQSQIRINANRRPSLYKRFTLYSVSSPYERTSYAIFFLNNNILDACKYKNITLFFYLSYFILINLICITDTSHRITWQPSVQRSRPRHATYRSCHENANIHNVTCLEETYHRCNCSGTRKSEFTPCFFRMLLKKPSQGLQLHFLRQCLWIQCTYVCMCTRIRTYVWVIGMGMRKCKQFIRRHVNLDFFLFFFFTLNYVCVFHVYIRRDVHLSIW